MAEVKNINGYDLKDYQLDTLQVSANEGKFVKIASNGLAADVVDLSSKQDKLTSENAGDNVTIIEGGGQGHNLPEGYTELQYVTSTTINKVVFNGNESWRNQSNDAVYLQSSITDAYTAGGWTTLNPAVSTHFSIATAYDAQKQTGKLGYYNYSNAMRIIANYTGGDADAFKAWVAAQYALDTPITLLYNVTSALSTPVQFGYMVGSSPDAHTYIPAKNSSDVAGLYCPQTSSFLTSINTGAFTAGPVIATTTKINALTGLTATVAELNYTDGVTSNIQTQLDNKVTKNNAITAATKTKITYDTKGLVTAGADLAASDIPNLDASKITSGTFADARIASASTWNNKQNALTAGTGISISNNVISSTVTFTLNGTELSITTS